MKPDDRKKVTEQVPDIIARINRISGRSLDGNVVMHMNEWNTLVTKVGAMLEILAEKESAQDIESTIDEALNNPPEEWTQHCYWVDKEGKRYNGLHPSLLLGEES